jgi:hypothetical protein
MQSTIEPVIAPHATSRTAESRGRRYLAILFILPLVAFCFPYFAERTELLQGATLSQLGQVLDASYRSANQNADVVLFGDSAVLYNIDPARLSQDLGLRVINLPNTRDSLAVTGDSSLRRYLETNSPPRLIVFFFAPWDLNLYDPDLRLYDGEEMLFRHGSWRQIGRFALDRPRELLLFPFRFYAAGNELVDYFHREQYVPPPVTLGHTPYPGASALPVECAFPSWISQIEGANFVERLSRDFTSSKTATMTFLSPVPNCLRRPEVLPGESAHLGIAAPVVLPAADFADDKSYTHQLRSSIPVTTEILRRAIKAKLGVGGQP